MIKWHTSDKPSDDPSFLSKSRERMRDKTAS
jgi:hypothetical protein